ncbi:MAG TPA: hypothetical protein VFW44_03855 [Bryobacteraceae bacterium]|nr:hypothetical protein [Bryobacteraceae bacterium]
MQSKWRMVSFRLSTEEYAAVQDSGRAAGYRSTSSFARWAVRAFLPAAGDQYQSEIKEIRQVVEEVVSELKRLSERLGNEHQQVCANCGSPRPSQDAEVSSHDEESANLEKMKAGGGR